VNRKIVAELVLSPRSSTIGISKPLKEALDILKSKKELKLETHAMGTNIECDDIETLFNAVKECHNYLINKYPRVVTTLKIDERTDKNNHTIQGKKKSILGQ
jgi:uncharacterized protein (TIGR00106 family)